MNITDSYTYKEMLDTVKLPDLFDFNETKQIAEQIGGKRIIFSGLGSSLIFPGNNAKNRALKLGIENKIDVYFASDLLQYSDFENTVVFISSNSGKTKETMLLYDHLQGKGAQIIGITAVADSPLAQKCQNVIILKGGFETGVAATKSVVEQGLLYESLVYHLAFIQGKIKSLPDLAGEFKSAAQSIQANITQKISPELVQKLSEANQYLYAGLDNGVGGELALKTNEMVRKPGTFFADTQILHGPAEVIDSACLFILEPKGMRPFIDDFKKFGSTTNSSVVSIDNSSLFEHSIPYSTNEIFGNYCLLSAGWGVLVNLASFLHVDVDNPKKIHKVGNPIV